MGSSFEVIQNQRNACCLHGQTLKVNYFILFIHFAAFVMSQAPAFLHCELAEKEKEKSCMAPTLKGARCRRPRCHGNFCRQHFLEFSEKESQERIWAGLESVFQKSAEDFEQAQLRMGLALSLEDMQEHHEQLKRSRALVTKRLASEGYERIDTAARFSFPVWAFPFISNVGPGFTR